MKKIERFFQSNIKVLLTNLFKNFKGGMFETKNVCGLILKIDFFVQITRKKFVYTTFFALMFI